MTLIVETGAGIATADALASLDFVDAYHTARGNTAWTGTDDAKEQAIRRASTFVSEAVRWRGYRSFGRLQAFDWPRSGVTDDEGFGVNGDEVPGEVLRAVAEAALREIATPGSLTPDYTPSERLASATVGPISVSYDLSRTDPGAARPVLLILQDILAPLILGGGTMVSGEVMR